MSFLAFVILSQRRNNGLINWSKSILRKWTTTNCQPFSSPLRNPRYSSLLLILKLFQYVKSIFCQTGGPVRGPGYAAVSIAMYSSIILSKDLYHRESNAFEPLDTPSRELPPTFAPRTGAISSAKNANTTSSSESENDCTDDSDDTEPRITKHSPAPLICGNCWALKHVQSLRLVKKRLRTLAVSCTLYVYSLMMKIPSPSSSPLPSI